eukprot:m.337616 g.337616  ORF g.337616 m.337616 type:complete len:90 (+) comp16533_c3_seq28:784-1053(+)
MNLTSSRHVDLGRRGTFVLVGDDYGRNTREHSYHEHRPHCFSVTQDVWHTEYVGSGIGSTQVLVSPFVPTFHPVFPPGSFGSASSIPVG